MYALPCSLAMGARQAIGLAGQFEVDAPTCGVQIHFLNTPRFLQVQRTGEQRMAILIYAIVRDAIFRLTAVKGWGGDGHWRQWPHRSAEPA